MANFFENVTELPPDPIFGVVKAFLDDKRADKIDAIAGTFRGEDLKPDLFSSVKKAERLLLEEEVSKEYLPIDGDSQYLSLTKELVFGKKLKLPMYGVQTVGGTGALSLAASFLKMVGCNTLYLGDPSWANHRRIFEGAKLKVQIFPYYNTKLHGVDFTALHESFEKMEEGAIVLMQPCCHNPTGCDLAKEQWKALFQLGHKRKLFFLLDLAYQGFGDGLSEDVSLLSTFLEEGLPGGICVSHSKTFGLYAERVGALFLLCGSEKQKSAIGSQICPLIRANYSNPPCHGARIVSYLLKNPALKKEWEGELAAARVRIGKVRALLAKELKMDFLKQQKGMFAFMGLEASFVQKLKEQYGLYLPRDGRINAAGINLEVAASIARTIKDAKKEL